MISKHRSGFTLLELLLFIVLAGITTALLAFFLFRITQFSTANSVANSVDQGGAQMMSNIEFFLKDTIEIIRPEVGSEQDTVTLRTKENDILNISLIDNQLIYTNETTQESFVLNPNDTTVDNVSFQFLTGISPTAMGSTVPTTLSIDLTLSYTTPNVATDSFEYDYTKTYATSILFPNQLEQLNITEDLELWLRTDMNLVINSPFDNVVSWRDIIQNKAFTVPSGSAPEVVTGVGGYPAISFNGVNSQLQADSVLGLPQGDAERTIFVVTQPNDFTTSAYDMILDYGTADTAPASTRFGIATRLDSTDGAGIRYNDGVFMESTMVPEFEPAIFTAWYDSNRSSLFKGSSLLTSEQNVTLATTGSTMTLGSGTDITGHFEGQISEILVYSRALSTSERSAVTQYLNRKYSIQSSSQ